MANTTADNNTAVGYNALASNTTGLSNTAVGSGALDATIGGSNNAAVGTAALGANTTGNNNVAMGSLALDANTEGASNCGFGLHALGANTTASNNTAVGQQAGRLVSTGAKNTFMGSLAGDKITTGDKNIFIGYDAGSNTGPADTEDGNIIIGNLGGQNCTATNNIGIGDETNFQGHTNTIVMGLNVDSVASNTFTFGKGDGNDRVSNGYTSNATFARVSDVRYKKEIKDNDDCGLDFINDLRPVTFKWKAKSEINKDLPDYDATKTEADHKEKLYGLIAQEVKEALDKNNITDFGGWEKEKTSGINKVAQAMFIYPLIKAVQELSEQVTTLQSEIAILKGE